MSGVTRNAMSNSSWEAPVGLFNGKLFFDMVFCSIFTDDATCLCLLVGEVSLGISKDTSWCLVYLQEMTTVNWTIGPVPMPKLVNIFFLL